jgi:hypothetical protein
MAAAGVAFSVREIPFSYYGSWLDISPVIAEQVYAEDLHLVSHQTGLRGILSLVPLIGGARADAVVTAEPTLLRWAHGAGAIDVVYENADTIRIRGHGLGLRIAAAGLALTPFAGSYLYRDPRDGAYIFTVYGSGRRYRVTVLSGHPATSAGTQTVGVAERTVTVGDDGGRWEIALEEFEAGREAYQPSESFDDVSERAAATFASFVDDIAPWRTDHTPAAELAAYVMWSATVRPSGFVTRPAVLMSKHWMDKVWSWDHCFNALALVQGKPELAWDQFWLPFDHQDAAGALPDSVAHSEVLYNFVKPPIHGWAFQQLRQHCPLTRTELAEAYEKLEAWTAIWLTARRAPGHALAHYQHGNDSGWDNATTFDGERVIETSDLAAFLVIQLRVLAEIASELNLGEGAARWSRTASDIQAAMLAQLWTGDRFVARGVESDRTWSSASLLDLTAIALGAQLPSDVREHLATGIQMRLTSYGLATEPTTSPLYRSDGYWRGPVWAPSTVIIEDGLRRGGFADLADEISGRFRALCEKSGFAENFDAQSGLGLRDRAYTWTASSYLLLAGAYEQRRRRPTPRQATD